MNVDKSEIELVEHEYRVVVNLEEQYSIWPTRRALPLGWTDISKTGTRADCLKFIGEMWTDMRPLGMRRNGAATSSGTYRPSGPEDESRMGGA